MTPSRPKKFRIKMDPLTRMIRSREVAIARMEEAAKDVIRRAENEAGAIRKRIAQKKVILEALRRGELKA